MNHLSKNTIRPGTHLLIPSDDVATGDDLDGTEEVATNPLIKRSIMKLAENLKKIERSSSYTLQPGDTIYITRPRDTIKKIAAKFHITTHLSHRKHSMPRLLCRNFTLGI